LLKDELTSFRKNQGYLPKIITVQYVPAKPGGRELIEDELKQVAVELNADIIPGLKACRLPCDFKKGGIKYVSRRCPSIYY